MSSSIKCETNFEKAPNGERQRERRGQRGLPAMLSVLRERQRERKKRESEGANSIVWKETFRQRG